MTDTDTERDERLRGARAIASNVREETRGDENLMDDIAIAMLALDAEVARLDAVVTAVREEHVPGQWETDGPGVLYRDCVACAQPYPCPTVRALDGGAA